MENDSNGQLTFLAAEVFRYTHDRKSPETVWPRVQVQGALHGLATA